MLHWEKIKGFYGTLNSGTDLLYTYITFSHKRVSDEVTSESNRPHIKMSFTETGTPTDLGYIICNEIDNTFKASQSFDDSYGLFFNASNVSTGNKVYGFKVEDSQNLSIILPYQVKNNQAQIQLYAEYSAGNYTDCGVLSPYLAHFKVDKFFIDTRSQKTTWNYTEQMFLVESKHIQFDIDTANGGHFQIYGGNLAVDGAYMSVAQNDDTGYYYSFSASAFKSQNGIHAPFFNATSDKRAKENLHLLTTSALDIVNNVQVYSFNLKKNKEKSIGLLAQDLVDKSIDDFNFVENITATGENDDYMSIHESKLVYVLWKAVQELSAEVELLKKELNR